MEKRKRDKGCRYVSVSAEVHAAVVSAAATKGQGVRVTLDEIIEGYLDAVGAP